MSADDGAPGLVKTFDLPIQYQTAHDVRFWNSEPCMPSLALVSMSSLRSQC
jgi:hypothetical protein